MDDPKSVDVVEDAIRRAHSLRVRAEETIQRSSQRLEVARATLAELRATSQRLAAVHDELAKLIAQLQRLTQAAEQEATIRAELREQCRSALRLNRSVRRSIAQDLW